MKLKWNPVNQLPSAAINTTEQPVTRSIIYEIEMQDKDDE